MTEPKRRHLSDGAIAAMREDIASNRAGGQVHVADDYVEKALDEIAWLRWRESELQLTISGKTFYDPTDVRVVELTGKALAYDLDQAGIESRTAEAVELVVLRARELELESRSNDWAVRAGAADRERIKSEARVAVLKLRLADAMEQIEAIQGSNATHMASVAKLEGRLADSVTDLTEMSEPAKRLRGQIEAAMAPRPMSEAPDDGRQMMGVSSEQPTPVTDDPDRILSGWCVVSVLCDSCDDSKDGAS